jgi:deazaflavin-dependent oxidoreductase (nitroreductase family)
MPRWVASANKRFFNPREIRKGVRPVLVHVGRSSGSPYRTPLDAHAVDGGYLFIPVYGPDSDWVQNILASGTATLLVEGTEASLVNPRLVGRDEAAQLLEGSGAKPPSPSLRIMAFLRMDTDST